MYSIVIILFTCIHFLSYFHNNTILPSIIPDNAGLSINNNINECKILTSNINLRSIFVGRKNYDRFSYNNAMLYFTYPNIKPATSFISDEPGLQNSCKYGKIIAHQLNKAEKPMLVFIDANNQPAENDLMESMNSCNKIEEYLNSSQYLSKGYCSANKNTYEIRLYEK
jgi:hypothetical protein